MKRTLAAILGAAALALSHAALAQYSLGQRGDLGFYLGGAVGQAKLKDWCTDDGSDPGATLLACDAQDTAWKIFGGYQFHPNFAFELQLMNLGTVSATVNDPFFGPVRVSADNNQLAGSLVGILPVGAGFQLFGKIGVETINQQASASVAGLSSTGNGSDSGMLFGLGVKYAIGQNLRLRGEWEHGDTLNMDVMTLGAEWRF